MSRSRRNCARLIVVSFGFLVVSAGCNSSRLTHFDSRKFDPLFELGRPEAAYVAVDSCATGVHAIVALELDPGSRVSPEAGRVALRASEALPLTLIPENQKPVAPQFSRLEGPICMPISELYGANRLPMLSDPTKTCLYVYHAEFELISVPRKGSEMVLQYGGQEITLAVKQ